MPNHSPGILNGVVIVCCGVNGEAKLDWGDGALVNGEEVPDVENGATLNSDVDEIGKTGCELVGEIGRASCRERV